MAEVRLRRWRRSDIDDVAVMAGDESLRHWSSLGEDLEVWIEREVSEGQGPSRAVCLPDDDRAIGRVAVRPPELASDAVRCEAVREADQPAGELSYWLVPDARGRGLASAAVSLMIGSLVPAMGLRSVVLDIEDDNAPSIRLAERLGAERRSPVRVKVDRTGAPRTLVVYVLAVSPTD
jgi:[ribosomal protein S5]-alanine N-acetyltransferase